MQRKRGISTNASSRTSNPANLERHSTNLKKFGLPIVVALNLFPTDTNEEKQVIYDACERAGVAVADSDVFTNGGKGGY